MRENHIRRHDVTSLCLVEVERPGSRAPASGQKGEAGMIEWTRMTHSCARTQERGSHSESRYMPAVLATEVRPKPETILPISPTSPSMPSLASLCSSVVPEVHSPDLSDCSFRALACVLVHEVESEEESRGSMCDEIPKTYSKCEGRRGVWLRRGKFVACAPMFNLVLP